LSVVNRGADTLASKQHPVPPTRHITIRGFQGTSTTGFRHLTKSRVKRISKHMIQSKCSLMTAVLQTEGLPTLSKKVTLDTELHSVVVHNHAQAYHLVNKVYHHQAVV